MHEVLTREQLESRQVEVAHLKNSPEAKAVFRAIIEKLRILAQDVLQQALEEGKLPVNNTRRFLHHLVERLPLKKGGFDYIEAAESGLLIPLRTTIERYCADYAAEASRRIVVRWLRGTRRNQVSVAVLDFLWRMNVMRFISSGWHSKQAAQCIRLELKAAAGRPEGSEWTPAGALDDLIAWWAVVVANPKEAAEKLRNRAIELAGGRERIADAAIERVGYGAGGSQMWKDICEAMDTEMWILGKKYGDSTDLPLFRMTGVERGLELRKMLAAEAVESNDIPRHRLGGKNVVSESITPEEHTDPLSPKDRVVDEPPSESSEADMRATLARLDGQARFAAILEREQKEAPQRAALLIALLEEVRIYGEVHGSSKRAAAKIGIRPATARRHMMDLRRKYPELRNK